MSKKRKGNGNPICPNCSGQSKKLDVFGHSNRSRYVCQKCGQVFGVIK